MLFGRSKKLEMPSPQASLPGRQDPIPTAAEHFVNRRPLKGPYPEGSEVAYFALGCYWGAEKAFWSIPGFGLRPSAISEVIRPIQPMKRCAPGSPAMPRG